MFTQYLPTFKAVEINRVTGLTAGHMLSQFPANAALTRKVYGDHKFIENGLIVGLGADGTVENYEASKHAQIFLHYSEELYTLLDELKYFAIADTECPRCVALYIGDTFTTDNFAGTLEGAKFAKVVNGVATLQETADTDTMFIAVETTMPNGDAGVELTLYRIPTGA